MIRDYSDIPDAPDGCVLSELAEHLTGCGVNVTADKLDYSLNRCGLLVVAEERLIPTPAAASDSDAPEWFIWAWLALLLLSPAMVWALGGEL